MYWKLSSQNGIVKCYQVTDTNNSTQLNQNNMTMQVKSGQCRITS